MDWLGPLREFVLAKSNSGHRVPGVANVARGPPKVSADIRAPFPNIEAAILAKAVDDRTFRLQQRVTHDLIDRRHFLIGIERARAAPVILQIIDSPRRVGARVLFLVTVAAFIAGAGV